MCSCVSGTGRKRSCLEKEIPSREQPYSAACGAFHSSFYVLLQYIELCNGDANLLRESLEAVQQAAAVVFGAIVPKPEVTQQFDSRKRGLAFPFDSHSPVGRTGGSSAPPNDSFCEPFGIDRNRTGEGEPFFTRWLSFLGWHRVMFVDDLPLAILFTKAHGESELQLGGTSA